MATYFSEGDLLSPPTERAAFSDRQAYVCAELSKLAYFKFEGGHTLSDAIEAARTIFGDDPKVVALQTAFEQILSASPTSAQEAEAALSEILTTAGFQLLTTFSARGTQAFICTRKLALNSGGEKVAAYLVFRGTEPKQFSDIKTDARAAFKTRDCGGESLQFHQGYLKAFELIERELERVLNDTDYDQLFITGHSLGGALAMVATRILAVDVVGACYTFGAPPIGTIEIQNKLKTPIYQIINEVDIVPRLPNPWLSWATIVFIRIVRLFLRMFAITADFLSRTKWDQKIESFLETMTKYQHCGYKSYLVGQGQSAHLRYNVNSFYRFSWWAKMMGKRSIVGFKKMIADHSIDTYLEKLTVHARRRQQ